MTSVIQIKVYIDRDRESKAREEFLSKSAGLKVKGNFASNKNKWIWLEETDGYFTLVAQNISLDNPFGVIHTSVSDECIVEIDVNESVNINVTCNEEKERELIEILRRFCLYTYLLMRIHRKIEEKFLEVVSIDKEVKEKYGWDFQKHEITLELLSDLERYLERSSRCLSSILGNFHMMKLHFRNLILVLQDLSEYGRVSGDVERVIDVRVREAEHRLSLAKVVYDRLKDSKDLVLGKLDFNVKRELADVQREVLEVQKHSYAMQLAGLVIEFFIIFAYSIKIWESVNPAVFEHSSLVVKMFAPFSLSLGIVFVTKFVVFSINGGRLRWILLILGVVLVVLGLSLMGLRVEEVWM